MFPISIRGPRGWEDPWTVIRREFDRFLRGDISAPRPEGPLLADYPVDIREEDDALIVDAEVPGFKRDEINVTVEDNTLRITAERKAEEPQGTEHLSERRFTRIDRAFTLPARVDESQAEATLQDGILRLRLPKSQEARPRQIEVKSS